VAQDAASGTPFWTNSFTWTTASKDKPATSADARDLNRTYSWDNLGRLTSVSFPDSTALSYSYDKVDGVPFPNSNGGIKLMDLTATKDRLNRWTYFEYNTRRQLTAVTNRLSKVTRYSWCDCGSLESVRDPLINYTYFYYDLQSRLTNIVYPGVPTTQLNVRWDELGQPTNVYDTIGSVNYAFNHQGLVRSASTSFG